MVGMKTRRAGWVGLWVALLSGAATEVSAQTPPYLCGPDCTSPGRYVLCNDAFDTTSASPGAVRIVAFLDTVCAQFAAPAANFDLVGFAALLTAGDQVVTLLDVRGTTANATPGPSLFDTGVGIPSAASDSFTGLFFGPVALTTSFRICMRQQLDDPGANATTRGFRYDGDGFSAPNPVLLQPASWQDASATAITGDFILRAVVRHDDLTPWGPGGACQSNPDGGVVTDAGTPADSGPNDGGVVDTGAGDVGIGLDATPGDTGPGDAGIPPDSGTEDDGGLGPVPPPSISAISPNQASNVAAVDVLVTGGGFQDGLTLKIGPITASEVEVRGAGTISAQVPPSIAAGSYDVVVENPDGQVAILPKGFTVLGADGASQASSDCRCASAGSGDQGWAALAVIPLGWWIRRRRRR